MGLVTKTWGGLSATSPYPPADGAAMEGYLDAITTVVNGNIDDTNVKSGADINGSKLLNASIPAGKYGAGSIVNADMAAGTIQDGRIDWTTANGLKALRTAAALRVIAFGQHTITTATWGTAVSSSPVITFASGDDSPPNFATTTGLRVVCQIQTAEADEFVTRITAVTTSSFTVEVKEANGASITPGANINVNWIAIGRIA